MYARSPSAGWEEFLKAYRKRTPRSLRACRFADYILQFLGDNIPRCREFQDIIRDELTLRAFIENLEIISVPPEKDALDKMQLERAMIEQHPMFILAKSVGPDITKPINSPAIKIAP